ncbi:MAG: amidohydrolase [Candidatus Hodarchaeales archaeon]|jgi:5-methylthioadenosine/S-adenosylhomocysteine deaminase
MDLVIDCKWLFYPAKNKLIENGRLIIEGNLIVFSGSKDDPKAQSSGHDHYKFKKGLALPGLVNAHTHLPETLLRGVCDDKPLQSWLNDIWAIERHMSAEDAYWGSLLGMAEMISCGTIGFNDQYFYSSEIAKAADKTGIKANLAPSIFYDGNPEASSMEEAFVNAKNTITKWQGKKDRIWVGLGPHAPYTVGFDWFSKLAEESRKLDIPLHTHLNETEFEVQNSLKERGLRPIEWLEKIGILDRIGSAAHCIYLSEAEIDLLRKYNITVLHCPKSNLKIGAGIANIPKLLESNVNVCLGTDGQASNNKLDMFEEIAMEVLLHKGINKNPLLIPSHQAIKMATVNASKLFPKEIYSGTLEENTRADIAIIDMDVITTTPVINPVSHLTYVVGRENVVMTIVDGVILYYNNEIMALNIKEIKEKSQNITEKLLEKASRI